MSRLREGLGIEHPLIVAPMAGGPSSVALVVAASRAGALGSVGAAYSPPAAIEAFAAQVRAQTDRPFAVNLFIPHEVPEVSAEQMERALRATATDRAELGLPAPTLAPPYEESFDDQFESVLRIKPAVFSFVFGALDGEKTRAAKERGIKLIGTATTLPEALALQESGVDAITLQGFEGGGHRGIFEATATDSEIPLRRLLEVCSGPIRLPLIAAGGLMNANDIAAARSAGADAVQLGTAFLACAEAGTSAPYRQRLRDPAGRTTRTTRVFSGRLARGIGNRFMTEMESKPDAILPFPVQNKFTRDLRTASAKAGSSDHLSLWSGTGAGELWTGPAQELIARLFDGHN